MTDFQTWLLDCGRDRVFRMLEFRRPGDWTPREIEKKWMDQSQYVSDQYEFVKIVEAIELPDGDILLGMNYVDPDAYPEENYVGKDWIHYRKLSQIELLFMPKDMEVEDEECEV